MNRTLVGEVQALCTPTVLDQQNFTARSLELRSGAYRAPALPVELYQRSWRGDSNADHGLTRPVLFLLSYASHKSGGGGENCTPDDLLCRETPRCLGYTTSQHWSGRRDSNPRSRRWQRRVLATRRLPPLKSWSEQRELNSRHRVGGPRHQPLYHARHLAGVTGFEPLNSFWRQRPAVGTNPPQWRSQRELNPSLLIDGQVSCRYSRPF